MWREDVTRITYHESRFYFNLFWRIWRGFKGVLYLAGGEWGGSVGRPYSFPLFRAVHCLAKMVTRAETPRRKDYFLSVPASLRCFVNIATSSVYGKYATDDEETPPKPTSYYGVTKLAAEQLVLARQREKGFPACSLRIFSVIGPRERPEKLYPLLMQSILKDTPFPLFEGSLEHARSYTYVGDIVAGFLAVLTRPERAVGEIFNIGSTKMITTGEGIAIVENILGQKAQFDIQPKRAGDQLQTQANIEKARRILGYEPQTSLEDGLAVEAAWYLERIHGRDL